MARLTKRNSSGVAYVGRYAKLPGLDCAGNMKVAAVRECLDRLAEYEDTGLSPEQIAELLRDALRKN